MSENPNAQLFSWCKAIIQQEAKKRLHNGADSTESRTTNFPFESSLLTGIKNRSRTGPEVKFVEISTGNFAFSAVIDQRDADDEEPKQAEPELESIRRSQIRVMMAVTKSSNFSCQFADGLKIPGKMLEIGSGVGYLNCLAPKNISLESIDEITICDDTLQKSAIVPISYRIPKKTISFDQTFAICVPLIFGEKYTAEHFVEFVEMNRLLGVEQISIYTNGSLDSKLKVVMEKYSNQGFLEVISFLRPFNDDKVYYYGQHFTIADCLLRHIGRTEFVALQDLDEFAVVKVDENSSFSSPPNRLTFLPELFSNDKTAAIQLKIDYIVENKSELPFTLNNHEQIYYEGRTQYYSSKCIVRPHYFLTQNVHYPIDHARKDYRTDLSRTGPEVKFVEISIGNFAFSAVIDQRNADDEEPEQAESELESIRRSQIRVMMAVTKSSNFSCQMV
ncbi:unnamed protein product, partial [Mesorhabditis belari]|uniref:Glycosyltransferase family 92 protein n=1 Tax=Mesorhabditis belari TaxID=2138241 RepID=A0AAF3F3Y2_9BILA